MNQSLKVKVNDNFEFDIPTDRFPTLDLVNTSSSDNHLIYNNRSYKIAFVKEDFNNKSYKVKIDNSTYNIKISNALDQLINDLGFEIGNSKKIDRITAPMPGLILEIIVDVGDEINENDPLLILEAMKMENVISSPRQGIIKSISAVKGDAVEKNQLLIEFE